MKIVPDQLVRRFFAFMAGEFDDPSRYERLVSISLSQRLARQTGSALAVVDEADDIFVGVDPGDGNDPSLLGRAVLRRMTYVCCAFLRPAVL